MKDHHVYLFLFFHYVFAVFYIYVVAAHFTLGNYVLDGVNLLVAVAVYILHFKILIDYVNKQFIGASILQFIASIWQFINLTSSTIAKQKYNDESFAITIFSLMLLASGIYTTLALIFKRTYQLVNQPSPI